jgi:hypothetical protein
MSVHYFSRIYFSRYFYSNFKCTLKVRIKITRKNDSVYFYSDPYNYNINKKQNFIEISKLNFLQSPTRSYFFPVQFGLNGTFYDFSWKNLIFSKYSIFDLITFFVRLKLIGFKNFNFIKIYLTYFIKYKK